MLWVGCCTITFSLCRLTVLGSYRKGVFPPFPLRLTVPSYLTAHCEHVDAGYSVYVVWSEPRGVWTSVEVNVSGHTRSVLPNEKQEVKISGFQPARNYEVSLHSKSGQRSSGEPFVFSCLTDPRGERKRHCYSIELFRPFYCTCLCIWFLPSAGVIAGAVFAVLIFCLLVFLAVFIFFKRPDIIRLVVPSETVVMSFPQVW